MKCVVTAGQMQKHEQYIIEQLGLDAIVLMERAAEFAAKNIKKRFEKDDSILIVCGNGNNGADGIALARILTEAGYSPEVLLVGNKEKCTPLRTKQERMLRMVLGEVVEERIHDSLTDTKNRKKEYAVIVDAVLGIGTNRALAGEIKETVEWMNQKSGYKVALDIPTGICADTGKVLGTAFLADLTTTFGLCKQGLLLGDGKLHGGKVVCDPCGMVYPGMEPSKTFVLENQTAVRFLKRNPNGNKSTFGKLLFISGSETIAGAAVLGVCSAFRSGAGYIRLYTHENNRQAVLEAAPETVLELYNEKDTDKMTDSMNSLTEFASVVCVGSGLGTGSQAMDKMIWIMEQGIIKEGKTWIFDADALNMISLKKQWKEMLKESKRSVILTPHVAEFSRLSGMTIEQIKADPVKNAREFARENQCILVLKDAQTVVAHPDGRVCISVMGNDGMAVAGSGDVLAGIISGIAGQIEDPYMAACIGVYVHAVAGDMAAEKFGTHSMLPTDMIHCLKKCMKKLGKEAL